MDNTLYGKQILQTFLLLWMLDFDKMKQNKERLFCHRGVPSCPGLKTTFGRRTDKQAGTNAIDETALSTGSLIIELKRRLS